MKNIIGAIILKFRNELFFKKYSESLLKSEKMSEVI